MKVDNKKAIQITVKLGDCQDSRGITGPFVATSTGYTSVVTEESVKDAGDGGAGSVRRLALSLLEWAVEAEKQIANGS